MIFYTYIYLDTRKPGNYKYGDYLFDYEPMYVGKGKNTRWKDHWNYYGDWLGYKIRHIKECGLDPKVIFQGKDLDEQSAFDLEIELITIIGRIDLGTGPLVNLTSGGEGVAGQLLSEKTKKKISESHKGEKNHFYGKHHSVESKKKMSKSSKGKICSQETKMKMSETRKGLIPWNTGKTLSNEHKEKISKTSKGRTHSIEIREKISKSLKGKNKGKIPWNKGKAPSLETRKKISESRKKIGDKLSELMKGERNPMYGKTFSKEHIKKLSECRIGKKNHFYGKHHSEEAKKKMSEVKKGENNPMYKKHHSEKISERSNI